MTSHAMPVRARLLLVAFILIFGNTAMAAGIERSKPPVPSNAEVFGWASDIVAITEKYPQFRRMGTPGDAEVRRYIIQKLEEFGFENVEEQTYDLEYRHYDEWSLHVEGGQNDGAQNERRNIPAYFMRGSGFTEEAVTGELLYVGESIDSEADYSGKIVVFDVRGQAVPGQAAEMIADFVYDPDGSLAKGTFGGKAGPIPANFPIPYYMAAEQGAVAMVAILKDYDTGTNRFYSDPSAMVQTRIPGLFLGKYDGEDLIKALKSSADPIQATLVNAGEVRNGRSANIVATLPGQKAETLLINTHHDAGWLGGVQDASGISTVLGLARYYSRIPDNFRQKTMVFVFDGSHYGWNYPMGANIFWDENPEVMEQTVLAIGIEHIAKKFKAEKSGYVDTGEIEPRILFTPPNQLLFDATKRAIVEHNMHSVIIPRKGAIAMFGETQSYFLRGVPSYSYISGPEYLFLEDDTLDKIAADQFETVISTFISIIDTAMYVPGAWLKRIDR